MENWELGNGDWGMGIRECELENGELGIRQ